MTTEANEDCSRHLLTDVKDGTLLRFKHNVNVYKEKMLDPEEFDGADLIEIVDVPLPKGDIVMLIKQQVYELQEPEHCYIWRFELLHNIHMRVFLMWDMNDSRTCDIDTVLERAMTDNV